MRLASDNEHKWYGISGILIVVGILIWLFTLEGPDHSPQALHAKFGVAAEESPDAGMSAKDPEAATN